MKAEAPRLLESAYPEFIRITTRFGDMDFNGHLNNVAFAQFFEGETGPRSQTHVWRTGVDGIRAVKKRGAQPLEITCGK